MRETSTANNLANMLMGHLGKGAATASQKKAKARLLKVMDPQAADATAQTTAKGKRKLSNAKLLNVPEVSTETKKTNSEAVVTDAPVEVSFQDLLAMAANAKQGQKQEKPVETEKVEAVSTETAETPKSLSPAQQVLQPLKQAEISAPNQAASAEEIAPQQTAQEVVRNDLPEEPVDLQPQLAQEMPELEGIQNEPQVETQSLSQVVPIQNGAAQRSSGSQAASEVKAPAAAGQMNMAPNLAQTEAAVAEIPALRMGDATAGGGAKPASAIAAEGAPVSSLAALQFSAATPADTISVTAPATAADGRAAVHSLGDQVARAAASLGQTAIGHQVVIQLNPPELGRVRLMLESRDDGIRGVLRVDDPGTLAQLRQETPSLVQRMSQNGLEVRQIDIVPTAQLSSQAHAFAQGQDGQAGRQQQSSPWRDQDPQAPQGNNNEQTSDVLGRQYVSADSINAWA